MHFNAALAVLAASCPIALAAPATSAPVERTTVRLVKTSEVDPGQWVDEKDLFDKFTAKGVNFIDITDIKDDEVLAVLSGTASQSQVAAVKYPDTMQHVDETNKLIAQSNTDGPKTWMKGLSDFFTRDYTSQTGLQASNWYFEQIKKIASPNADIKVIQYKHRFTMPSIIATIPGANKEIVVVGAHLDSTGGRVTTRSPGADDNASGSVTTLEAFRVLVSSGFKPKNTLEFHWYSGEEGGLLGSKDIWASYKASAKPVIAMLNQDMTGYSPSNNAAVITDNVDAPLTSYVTKIFTQYTGKAPLVSKCGYGCSDHASARANGFPSAFVFEDEFGKDNPSIHSPNDTMDKISWTAVQRHIKLTIGFLVEASYI